MIRQGGRGKFAPFSGGGVGRGGDGEEGVVEGDLRVAPCLQERRPDQAVSYASGGRGKTDCWCATQTTGKTTQALKLQLHL